MTLNTHHRRPHNGLKTTILKFYHGQHSLQTLIPLNTCGNISNNNFTNMKLHQKEHMDYGIDWLMSGMEFYQKYVKSSWKVCPGAYRQLSRQEGVIPSTRWQNNTCLQNCPNESPVCFVYYSPSFYWNIMVLSILECQDGVVCLTKFPRLWLMSLLHTKSVYSKWQNIGTVFVSHCTVYWVTLGYGDLMKKDVEINTFWPIVIKFKEAMILIDVLSPFCLPFRFHHVVRLNLIRCAFFFFS